MAEQRQDGEFERQLAAFTPRAGRVNRERLLFCAGQESVRPAQSRDGRVSRYWALSTVLLALLATSLSWRLHDQPQIIERIKYVEGPTSQSITNDREPAHQDNLQLAVLPRAAAHTQGVLDGSPLIRGHYLNQRRLALTMGLDALSAPLSGDSGQFGQTSYRELKTTVLKFNAIAPATQGDDL
jgi:hypothetical protein